MNYTAAKFIAGAVHDVGCGRGMMLNNLRRLGYRTTGIALSNHAAHHARDILGNLFGFKTNLLYSIPKHEAARSVQLSRHPIRVAANVLLPPILLPLSIALTVFDAGIRSGGTMEMYEVKE